jgi:hypothetical protein
MLGSQHFTVVSSRSVGACRGRGEGRPFSLNGIPSHGIPFPRWHPFSWHPFPWHPFSTMASLLMASLLMESLFHHGFPSHGIPSLMASLYEWYPFPPPCHAVSTDGIPLRMVSLHEWLPFTKGIPSQMASLLMASLLHHGIPSPPTLPIYFWHVLRPSMASLDGIPSLLMAPFLPMASLNPPMVSLP